MPIVDAGPDATIDPGDTFSSSARSPTRVPIHGRVTVDYGDGTLEELTLADKTFALSHIYTTPGSYTVTVTITDDDGRKRL